LYAQFWLGIGLVGINALYVATLLPESKTDRDYTPFQWRKLNPLFPFFVLWSHKYSFCLGISPCAPSPNASNPLSTAGVAYFISLLPQEGMDSISVVSSTFDF
jgi:hypothetical protein